MNILMGFHGDSHGSYGDFSRKTLVSWKINGGVFNGGLMENSWGLPKKHCDVIRFTQQKLGFHPKLGLNAM